MTGSRLHSSPAENRFLKSDVSSERYYINLQTVEYLPLEQLEVGMTYNVFINSAVYSDDPALTGDTFHSTAALCTEIRKFGDLVLWAKFNLRGSSTLVSGNYGLTYLCTPIIH
jgi:hypothetical protein